MNERLMMLHDLPHLWTDWERQENRVFAAKEVAEAWRNWRPKIPLSYTLAQLDYIRRRDNGWL